MKTHFNKFEGLYFTLFIIIVFGGIGVLLNLPFPESSRTHSQVRDYTPMKSVSINSKGIACGVWTKNRFDDVDVTVCFKVYTGVVLPRYRYSW